jgi:hypothetical protein
MIRRASWLAPLNAFVLLWHECGENLAVFCYRISRGALVTARARGYMNIPAAQIFHRNSADCSNPSVIFSTPFTTSKD